MNNQVLLGLIAETLNSMTTGGSLQPVRDRIETMKPTGMHIEVCAIEGPSFKLDQNFPITIERPVGNIVIVRLNQHAGEEYEKYTIINDGGIFYVPTI